MNPMTAGMAPAGPPQGQPPMDPSQLPPQLLALLQMLAQGQGAAPAGPPEGMEGGGKTCPNCGMPC